MSDRVLADTSAWVEYFRGTGSGVNRRMRKLVAPIDQLATTDVVLMEVLAGARDRSERDALRRLLSRYRFEAVDGPRDYEDAAEIYRACRRGGVTLRNMLDCLIAAVAIRSGVPVLHADRDFDVIARHTPLTVA